MIYQQQQHKPVVQRHRQLLCYVYDIKIYFKNYMEMKNKDNQDSFKITQEGMYLISLIPLDFPRLSYQSMELLQSM